MKLSSPEFNDGEQIPERHGYMKDNTNPVLEIREVPDDAESLVLLMDDPDAVEPAGKIWDHWTVWNIPPETEKVEEDGSPGTEGMTDFRKTGYNGPNPPDRPHTYRFRVYALDTELELPEKSEKSDVLDAAEGHILDKSELKGTFEPL